MDPESSAKIHALAVETNELVKKLDVPKRKDRWDKLAVASSFVSTVLLASVGLVFTKCYDERQATEQRDLRIAQQRVAELDVISKLIPQLANTDPSQREWAALVLRAVVRSDSASTADSLGKAATPPGRAASPVLLVFADLATRKNATPADRGLAVQSLAAVATARSSSPALRAQAEGVVARLAVDDSVPAETRQLARAALGDIRSVTAAQIAATVNEQPVTRAVNEVILHHTISPSISQYSGAATIDSLLKIATQVNGWSDIPWHFAVAPDGAIWVGRPLDRACERRNAQQGFNRR
jgi:hypothetical protein